MLSIENAWSFSDLEDAHALLDELEDAEARAREPK